MSSGSPAFFHFLPYLLIVFHCDLVSQLRGVLVCFNLLSSQKGTPPLSRMGIEKMGVGGKSVPDSKEVVTQTSIPRDLLFAQGLVGPGQPSRDSSCENCLVPLFQEPALWREEK